MKICQVIASKGEGGLEKHVRELTRQLVDAGHEVVVFGDPAFLATLAPQAGRQPIRCDRSRRNPMLLLDLLFKLRHCRCDIIHAQANKAASLIGTLRRWLPCPTVGTLHNIKRDNRAFHRLDHIITVSRQLAVPFQVTQKTVVYNGIDMPRFEHVDLKTEFDLPADRPVLCTVGRLVKAKGFDVLLEAIDGLPLSLIIAGEGPERARLEQRIKRLKPDTHCRMPGYRTDTASLMASADAVILSSRREGFSYVFNEALLLGARVLATDVPVANEVLPPELIVPIENVQDLRQHLQTLLGNREAWSSMMEPAHAFARKHMTLTAMGADTLAVYNKVLAHA